MNETEPFDAVIVDSGTARLLADCPSTLLIVYTPGPGAEARGYEDWLRRVDNPFFNAIPGVHHYANWRLGRVLHGSPPGWSHFDFQGLVDASDLERVWFNPDLDQFRTEWIRLWGYGAGSPPAAQANAYLMQPRGAPRGMPDAWARVTAGRGTPPAAADRVWVVTETIRKHFAASARADPWRVPAEVDNPLGLDWFAIEYGPDEAALAASYHPGHEVLAATASLIAAP